MKTNLIKIIFSISISIGTILFPAAAVFADSCSDVVDICSSNYPDSVKAACGCTTTSGDLATTIVNILNGIIAFLGVIAVIFIIVGGVGYMTSSGDAGKIKKAKDTILYACIGLIICVLAFAIVNFVILNLLTPPAAPAAP